MYNRKSKRFLKDSLKIRETAWAWLGSSEMAAAWFDGFVSIHTADFY